MNIAVKPSEWLGFLIFRREFGKECNNRPKFVLKQTNKMRLNVRLLLKELGEMKTKYDM